MAKSNTKSRLWCGTSFLSTLWRHLLSLFKYKFSFQVVFFHTKIDFKYTSNTLVRKDSSCSSWRVVQAGIRRPGTATVVSSRLSPTTRSHGGGELDTRRHRVSKSRRRTETGQLSTIPFRQYKIENIT